MNVVPAIAIVGSTVVATMLVAAFVLLMSRVVLALDPSLRPRRRAGRVPSAPDGARDPDWWPRFERQFAEYVRERCTE